MQKKFYESRTEIINNEIIPSLGDAANDFDIEAIADEVTIYDFTHTPARVTMIEGDEFWEIAEKHDRALQQPYTADVHGDSATITDDAGTILGTIHNGSPAVFRDHHSQITPVKVELEEFTKEAIEAWAGTNLPAILD